MAESGKKKSKKQIIFEEAAKLFQEKGYSAASMRDLAERVNLKASSLYSHIRKKEEILQKICFDNAYHFTEGMRVIEAEDADPVEQIEALIALHIDIALDDPTSVTVFNDEWRHLEQPFLRRFLEMRRDYEQRFKRIIQAGIDEGSFKS
ncbi:MAG: TetR/AcrR family transcriptional regulator, partial [Phaeodactylibacter sp.]|nr:TetR/AcrR family transcriptional regulator [Phaeodactylibacter sp.]